MGHFSIEHTANCLGGGGVKYNLNLFVAFHLPTSSKLLCLCTSNGPPLSPWQASLFPPPAHIILFEIMDARYFNERHCVKFKIGTCASCTLSAIVPPSDDRPHPSIVPIFPAGSKPVYKSKAESTTIIILVLKKNHRWLCMNLNLKFL